MTLADRIRKPGRKKILALDGGGIRGMMSVEILAGIEDMLRHELKAGAEFVLADYFDFVAGTSTGAIIAACIAYGMSVARIREFYEQSGREMFEKASLLKRLHYKYDDDNLARKLKDELGAATALGDEKLRCLLMMVMRNATTDSPWPVSNNPFAKYNDRKRADCNLQLPLWQLVRASTAAPVFFPPEVVTIGSKDFIFVDGGVTMYNNPAFQAFLMATTQPYHINWETGVDQMLLVSVGTGVKDTADAALETGDMHLGYAIKAVPSALMYAAKIEQDFLCRVFGECKVGLPLDNEIGNMIGAGGPARPKLFTYMRYDADITQDGLDTLGLNDIKAASVQALDSVQHIAELQRLGRTVAQRSIDPTHYAAFLK